MFAEILPLDSTLVSVASRELIVSLYHELFRRSIFINNILYSLSMCYMALDPGISLDILLFYLVLGVVGRLSEF